MCGIAGFVTFRPSAAPELLARARAMADCISYRGPDAGGAWTDAEAGFATGHRRLSIVDLSEAGAQPMVSQSGRFVISYNGEIYNAAEIRAELIAKGYAFRGHSDTEVLLEACAEWGVAPAVSRMIGMFAFALWDRHERRLSLVRDRLGIKPLYWGQFGDLFLFGSELKALAAHPDFVPRLDRDAASSFLRFGYVPAPRAIYAGVRKLAPGTVLTLEAGCEPHIAPFWSLAALLETARREPFAGTESEAEDALAALLGDAIERRMVADVPLGAFLSGGIDSSTIVALMQSRATRPVRTFSIGFHEPGFNEAPQAAAVAKHLGTDHTELYVTAREAQGVIPRLADIYDEPFADSSQIPTFLVSEMTRRHVTVALSGDGGDELFGGYNRYLHAEKMLRWWRRLPPGLRRAGSRTLSAVPPKMWDSLPNMLPARWRVPQLANKMQKFSDALGADADTIYLRLVSQWQDPASIVVDGRELPHDLLNAAGESPDAIQHWQYLDALTYLPDDILTKLDRASMAVSLEARVPMLDHRVVAFAFSLPRHMRIRDGRSKWLLRRLLSRYVPERLIERPKMGFGVPIGAWLRGPLRDWAEDLLDPRQLEAEGLLRAEPIRAVWRAHLEGREDAEHRLWAVLMFEAWRRRSLSAKPGRSSAVEPSPQTA
jgi:asparagine synthase (glutamine-hydrolysing)